MPATSQSQQRFFALVRAHQEGKIKNPSKHIQEVAKSISKKDAHDFAATPRKGLPEKAVKQTKQLNQVAFKTAFVKQAQLYGFGAKEAKTLLSSALK